MNQPTEDRIKRLEEEQRQLKEEMRQLKEQITEPIKITRLEIDSGSIHKRLDTIEENTNITKVQIQGARADISIVKANQSDLKEYLQRQFKSIEDKQDAHQELLGQLLDFAELHEKNMATKNDIDRIEKTQVQQGDLLKLILAELRNPRGE